MKDQKTFYIRVRADYVGYYRIRANDLTQAEETAKIMLDEDMNDRVYPSIDVEEYDPKDHLPYNTSEEEDWDLAEKWTAEDMQENPDKYQSIQSDNQDIFLQEEELWNYIKLIT